MRRWRWWEILVPVLLVFFQLLISLGMYALNLRFAIIEVEISGVEKRLEDHMGTAKTRQPKSPGAVALVSPISRK